MTTDADEAEYRFLTTKDSCVDVGISAEDDGTSELQLFGNRAGLLSLANVLLWFYANAYRREFLSLGVLPFIRLKMPCSVCLRMTTEGPEKGFGTLRRVDKDQQWEWVFSEDQVKNLGLSIHSLVSLPEHGYDRFMEPCFEIEVHIRMTDVQEWM